MTPSPKLTVKPSTKLDQSPFLKLIEMLPEIITCILNGVQMVPHYRNNNPSKRRAF